MGLQVTSWENYGIDWIKESVTNALHTNFSSDDYVKCIDLFQAGRFFGIDQFACLRLDYDMHRRVSNHSWIVYGVEKHVHNYVSVRYGCLVRSSCPLKYDFTNSVSPFAVAMLGVRYDLLIGHDVANEASIPYSILAEYQAYPYWRIHFKKAFGRTKGDVFLRKIEMRTVVGGPNVCTTDAGTYFASFNSQYAYRLFDDTLSDISGNAGYNEDYIVGFHFYAAVSILQISLTPYNQAFPESFVLQASYAFATGWVDVMVRDGVAGWQDAVPKEFTLPRIGARQGELIYESLVFIEDIQTLKAYARMAQEVFRMAESLETGFMAIRSVASGVTFSDRSEMFFHFMLSEIGALRDGLSTHAIFSSRNREGVLIGDKIRSRLILFSLLVERLLLDDGAFIPSERFLSIVEKIHCADSLKEIVWMQDKAMERMFFNEAIVLAREAFLAEGIFGGDVNASFRQIAPRVVEAVLLSGEVTSRAQAHLLVAMAFALGDDAQRWRGFDREVHDAITLADSLARDWLAAASVLDGVLLGDQLERCITFHIILGDAITLQEMASFGQIIQQCLSDGIRIGIVFTDRDANYHGFVVNTEIAAVTEYSNFPFNALTSWRGEVYAASRSGIYRLTNARNDDGETIRSRIITGVTDFGSPALKQVCEAYVGCHGNGNMVLKTITGDGNAHWHPIRASHQRHGGTRVKMGRGVQSRYWQFELQGGGDEPFNLDNLTLYPVFLPRRER